MPITLTFH